MSQNLECKICTNLPKGQIVRKTCCNQLLGYGKCFKRATEEGTCPLCRSDNVNSDVLKGFEDIVSKLENSSK